MLETTSILTLHQKWPGLRQGFRITRTRTLKGVTTTEVHYGVTSLSEQEADAGRLPELVRGHWAIENNLHWSRDVTLGEDASQIHKGQAPQVMAALRNSIIHLLDGVAHGLASALRTMNNCLPQALKILGLHQLQ